MMTSKFHELLLSELHMAVYEPGNPEQLTDELLCKAVTMNENLCSLGYVLRPDDLVRIAVSLSLDDFYHHIRTLLPDIKAYPMYPGFPQQVMKMTEAEFRMHQMIHYFSTYGLENLLGTEMKRGWLPEYKGPARVQDDSSLLESRVIELVSCENATNKAIRMILNRRERLTNPELDLITEAVALCEADQLKGIKIRFKENLDLLFPRMMKLKNREAALELLREILAHSGDVLRCTAEYLGENHWHLSTSEKKLLVKLMESYSAWNFRENLMQSQHKRELNLRILQYLDYNRFSKSEDHREIVRALRNGELMSWHGVAEKMLQEADPGVLPHLAERPGYMLRMLNRLLSLGYSEEQLLEVICPKAHAISAHLILKALRTLSVRREKCEAKHSEALRIYRNELQTQIYAPVYELEKKIRSAEEKSDLYRQSMKRIDAFRHGNICCLIRNADTDYNGEDLIALLFDPDRYREAFECAREELISLHEQERIERERADARIEQEMAEREVRYHQELQKIESWKQQERLQLKQWLDKSLKNPKKLMEALQMQQQKEWAETEDRYQASLRMCEYDETSVKILKELLREHFKQATTPLKGRKIFCKLDQFDLSHSSLETEDRSKDGGYIRSGISWKIPEEAKYVRFFVYWDDPRRVDVDLHAGGLKCDGSTLHVGWNSDFRDCGVIHSGDITHSDAAEYIDIDLSAPIKEIYANVNLFYGRPSFREIETCYVGLMAVDQARQDVKLYHPKNCFFIHKLTQNTRNLFYGIIDVQNRFVRFIGQPNNSGWSARPELEDAERMFSMRDYLGCILEAQKAEIVESESDADVILTMQKGFSEKCVSLVDNNFFLEC